MQKKLSKRLSQRYNKDTKTLHLQCYLIQNCSKDKIQILPDANHLKISGLPISYFYDLLERPWTNLKKINLDFCKIGSDGIKILIKASMPSLKIFSIGEHWKNLGKCDISNEGMKHLSKSYWKYIEQIQIKSNFIGLNGYTSITNMICPGLKNMNTHSLSYEQNSWIYIFQMLTLQSNNFTPSIIIKNERIRSKLEQIPKSRRIINQK